MRSKAELRSLLWEQLNWIRTSAKAFDEGDRSEAKRIAVAIRTLVHDTEQSSALLSQLKRRDSMRWLSVGDMNSVNQPGDRPWMLDEMWPDGGAARVRPSAPTNFKTWWLAPLAPTTRFTVTREFLVLKLTNIDGGTHVDPELPPDYEGISRLGEFHPMRYNSVGMPYQDTSNPIPYAVRVIANEVLESLDPTAPELAPA